MKATHALLLLLATAAGLVSASPITTANNAVASAEIATSRTNFSTTASNESGFSSPSPEDSTSTYKTRAWDSGSCLPFRHNAEMWKECVKTLEACVPYAADEEKWEKCLEGLDKK